jgi:anti-sigma factor RsiW
MSTIEMNNENSCGQVDLVRDYAFDELAPAERNLVQQHLAQCSGCAAELDRLRLTTAALRVLPDQEVPQRIAFVSDKVVEQSWLAGIWNSAARLGFASACVLAAGLAFSSYHRDAAVNQAVAVALTKAHAEDAQKTQQLLVALQEAADYDRKLNNTHTVLLAQYPGERAQ